MAGARLRLEDRVRIEAFWVAGWTIPAIAAQLGRHRSTIWREVEQYHSARHGPKNPLGRSMGGLYRWGYRAQWAQQRAQSRARRPKTPRLGRGQPLRAVVVELLGQRWSPEQIAAHLRESSPGDRLAQVNRAGFRGGWVLPARVAGEVIVEGRIGDRQR
jgi:IS30 family transposase